MRTIVRLLIRSVLCALPWFAALATAPAAAAPVPSGGGSALADCHGLADPMARLLCYDQASGRPTPTDTLLPASSSMATPTPPMPMSDVADRATEPNAQPQSRRGLPLPRPASASVPPARLVRLERTSIGRHRFHLANGEIWEQLEPGPITLREGSMVNLRESGLGGWQMRDVDSASRSVRVRRLP